MLPPSKMRAIGDKGPWVKLVLSIDLKSQRGPIPFSGRLFHQTLLEIRLSSWLLASTTIIEDKAAR